MNDISVTIEFLQHLKARMVTEEELSVLNDAIKYLQCYQGLLEHFKLMCAIKEDCKK